MKKIKYLLALLAAGGLMASCDTNIEPEVIQKPYTYDALYYKNLRDYKASDHSISFMWFAQWGGQNSMATRFIGLPDSLDVVSIWGGGIPPKENTQLWEDLRFVQKVKGTKMLYVAIVRLGAEDDSHDFKKVLNTGLAMPQGAERDSTIHKAISMYADYYLDQVFENDLDGFDADYEPEGDFLVGDYFVYFMQCLAKYMGPNPNITKVERLKLIQTRYGADVTDTDKILCVDGGSPDIANICNYFFQQAYGGGAGPVANWPNEKVVYCCNMGDNWQTNMETMYGQARYQPSHGRKGGFGAFYGHRDYLIHQYNPNPYKRFRECIQIQNPAIY